MLTMTEAGDHGNCVISPEGDDEVQFFLMIGAGQHEKQNKLAQDICRAVNSHEALVSAARGLDEFAWSALTPDCPEAGEYLMGLVMDLRAALSLATGGRNEQ